MTPRLEKTFGDVHREIFEEHIEFARCDRKGRPQGVRVWAYSRVVCCESPGHGDSRAEPFDVGEEVVFVKAGGTRGSRGRLYGTPARERIVARMADLEVREKLVSLGNGIIIEMASRRRTGTRTLKIDTIEWKMKIFAPEAASGH